MRQNSTCTIALLFLAATLSVTAQQVPATSTTPPGPTTSPSTPPPTAVAPAPQPPTLTETEQLKAENLQLKVMALSQAINEFEWTFGQAHPGWGVNLQTGQAVQVVSPPSAPKAAKAIAAPKKAK
jgi:hypothetical protein